MKPQNKMGLEENFFAQAIYCGSWWRPHCEIVSEDIALEIEEREEVIAVDLVPERATETGPEILITTEAIEEVVSPIVAEVAPSTEQFLIFAVDVPFTGQPQFRHEAIADNDPEILIQKMISSLDISPTAWKLWVAPQGDEPLTEAHFSSFLEGLGDKSKVTVLSFGVRVTELMLGKRQRISEVHGQVLRGRSQLSVIPFFHPDYLMVNPGMKRTVWNDLQNAKKILE